MRIRPLSLLLAPLWLLLAIAILASCQTPANMPAATGAAGKATAIAITVGPAITTVPGIIPSETVNLSPPPAPTAIPSLPAGLSPSELKYRILAQYPDFFFCDPDFYPVARADEGDLALQRFPQIQANQEQFQAILAHNGLSGLTTFTDEQKQLIYREHKRLDALPLTLEGDHYAFRLTTGGRGVQGLNVQGTIDGAGRITIQQQQPGFATCPICLAAHTRIDTPQGSVLVENIRVGDVVWTSNAAGERVAEPVLKVRRVAVPTGHTLVHVKLEDGRELWASPSHPTADARRLADLQPGDLLDGSRVVLAERVSYDEGATYDLLPAGDTGFYWADGILMGSTLGGK